MRQTEHLKLALYDQTDYLSITGEENSLNRNMELLDQETKDFRNGLDTVTRQLEQVQQGMGGAVSYNQAQGLTDEQKTQARENIGAADANVTEQIWTEVQSIAVQNDVTEDGRRHDIVKKPLQITFKQDERFPDDPRIFYQRNLWPKMKYWNRSMPFRGLTVATDGDVATCTGTSTGTSEFQVKKSGEGDGYFTLEELGLTAGDVVCIHAFTGGTVNGFYPKVRFYDADKNSLALLQVVMDNTSGSYKNNRRAVPSGCVYVGFELGFNVNGADYDEILCPVFVKDSTVMETAGSFDGGLMTVQAQNEANGIMLAPHPGSVQHEVPLKTYIDSHSSQGAAVDMTAIREERSFVSPEQFGAIGDGKNDDTVAVQACIDYAIPRYKKVLGGGFYKISSPLRIQADGLNMELGRIQYTGTDAAVIYSGSNGKICIPYIWCSGSGAAIRIQSDIRSSFNHIQLGYVATYSDAIQLFVTNEMITTNFISFDILVAGSGGSCIYIEKTAYRQEGSTHGAGSNTFKGGKCQGGMWAVKGAGGHDNYETFHIEDIQNAFLTYGDDFHLIAPRIAELVAYSFDGDSPDRNAYTDKGKLVKCRAVEPEMIQYSYRPFCFAAMSSTPVYPHNFDLSDVTVEWTDSDGNTQYLSKCYPSVTTVECKLESRWTYALANGFIIFGRHILIKEPVFKMTLSVDAQTHGYAGDYSLTDKDDEFNIYEKFIVTEAGCDYTLPPSYDQIAFRRFKIEQQDGADGIFRDWRGTVIFDGSRYGVGAYTLEARNTSDNYWVDDWANSGQAWDVYRGDELIDTYLPVAAE